jgi:16S rRNA (uracil1498-N3)-methyltransferase
MRRFRIDSSVIEASFREASFRDASSESSFDSGESDAARRGGGTVPLSPGDANHVRNVLRLKPGDPVRLFDGRGAEYDARIASISADGVRAAVTGRVRPDTESPLGITIAQGFLKEKKMDTLIRQLTELGIRRWIPFFAERSVARPDSKRLRARKERWEKIAAESLKQCRRSRIPDIGETLSFSEMIEAAAGADLKIIFWEKAAGDSRDLFSLSDAGPYTTVFAVLGPEGGLSEAEVETAVAEGFTTAALGPRILRAETATVAACALLQYFLGDLGKNP